MIKRHDGLPGVDDFARTRRAHIDDAVDRRLDFGVREPDVGLGLLRGGGGLRVLIRLHLTAAHGDLLAVGLRECDLRALRLRLTLQGINLRLIGLELRPCVVEVLRGRHPFAREILRAARKFRRADSRSAVAAACCASVAARLDSA